jgi:hypothetical protein
MPRPITAEQSRELISFVRSQFNDQAYRIIKTDDEIFEFENFIQKEIAKNTFCLDDKDLEFAMIPNTEEYSLLSVIDTPQSILRIDEVSVIDTNGKAGKPLTKLTNETYSNYKGDTLITTPKYYNFDRNKFYILRPYSVAGYRIKIKHSRIPGRSEACSYDVGTVLPLMYEEYLKYGTAMLIALKYEEWSNKAPFYESMYKKYKTDYIKPTTSQNEKIDFREL